MKRYCYVIVNNAGHSWTAMAVPEGIAAGETNASILPQLLQDGWSPIRETPMGGGTSPLAHSLVLLEKVAEARVVTKRGRRRK